MTYHLLTAFGRSSCIQYVMHSLTFTFKFFTDYLPTIKIINAIEYYDIVSLVKVVLNELIYTSIFSNIF